MQVSQDTALSYDMAVSTCCCTIGYVITVYQNVTNRQTTSCSYSISITQVLHAMLYNSNIALKQRRSLTGSSNDSARDYSSPCWSSSWLSRRRPVSWQLTEHLVEHCRWTRAAGRRRRSSCHTGAEQVRATPTRRRRPLRARLGDTSPPITDERRSATWWRDGRSSWTRQQQQQQQHHWVLLHWRLYSDSLQFIWCRYPHRRQISAPLAQRRTQDFRF